MNETNGVIFALIFGTILIFATGALKSNSPEKTFYFASCSSSGYSIYDCPDKIYPFSMTYKVLIKEQKVINKSVLWVPSDSTRCSVFDEENWICENNEGSLISARDGKFFEKNSPVVTKGKFANGYTPAFDQIGLFKYFYYKNISPYKSIALMIFWPIFILIVLGVIFHDKYEFNKPGWGKKLLSDLYKVIIWSSRAILSLPLLAIKMVFIGTVCIIPVLATTLICALVLLLPELAFPKMDRDTMIIPAAILGFFVLRYGFKLTFAAIDRLAIKFGKQPYFSEALGTTK